MLRRRKRKGISSVPEEPLDEFDDVFAREPENVIQKTERKDEIDAEESFEDNENPFRRRHGNIIEVGGDPRLREENIERQKRRRVKKTRLFAVIVVLLIVAGTVYFVYTNTTVIK